MGGRSHGSSRALRAPALPLYRGLISLFSVHSDTPPLSVVRKFIHLLDLGDGDIREEAELLRLREEVVRSIRFNRQLEEDLNLMDLKIGLLVRNKATLQVPERAADPDLPGTGCHGDPHSPAALRLVVTTNLPVSGQDVVTHCKKLTKKNREQLSSMMDLERSQGLKALSRARRQRLEAYQHLFYLLQVRTHNLRQVGRRWDAGGTQVCSALLCSPRPSRSTWPGSSS